jgi:ADP-L-glycero-D-manno-heptose 6-epimerase
MWSRVNLWFFDHPTKNGLFNLGTGRAQPFNDVAHGRGRTRPALTDKNLPWPWRKRCKPQRIRYIRLPRRVARQVPVLHPGRPERPVAPAAATMCLPMCKPGVTSYMHWLARLA